jgi:hypothetical protein
MSPGRTGRRLFWLFFALYAATTSGNPFRVPDEFEVYFQAEHLLDAGDLSVPQTLEIKDNGQPIFFGQFGLDGKPYAPYGPAVAFLVLPFHAAGRAVAALAGVPRMPLPGGIPWEFVVGGITSFGMAFAAALAVAGAWRACVALGAAADRAVTLALMLGGATVLWPYGTTLYSEAWLAAAFAWAAAWLIEARTASGARWRVIAAAILIAVAGLTKPTGIVLAPAFVVAALFSTGLSRRARIEVAIVLAVAVALATGVHVAWNLFRFGRPLDFGYQIAEMTYPPARPFLPEQLGWGLFVQLLTPGKSLFVWAPIALLSLLSLGACWRREPGLAAGLASGMIAGLVFYAVFFLPEGGYSHGPRHFVPLVPLLILPLALPSVPLPRRALLACAAVGFTMAALAVTVSFFQDQAPVRTNRGLVSAYYEWLDPSPGAPRLRYRQDYIPFKHALTSGRWLSPERAVGDGPDFFAVHLARARTGLPGGEVIPVWLPWAVSLPWLLVFTVAALSLRRPTATLRHKDHKDQEDH